MNWLLNIRLAFLLQAGLAALMLIPMSIGIYNGEGASVYGFAFTILLVMVLTVVAVFLTKKNHKKRMSNRDGFFLVTMSWIMAAAFGAIPLVLSGEFSSYASAYFEIMSGFTTTGATTLSNIEACSRSILFWRSFTNWLGGMGIVVLFVALLPALGVGGTQLIGAESVGPTKDKLVPKARTTAMVLWLIYVGFSILQVIFLLFGGLSLYDSVTVTFSTMAAAGFCVKNASIGAFGSAYVETIVIIFMIISGANFALYYKLLTRKGKQVFEDGELRSYIRIIVVVTLACTISLMVSGYYDSFFTALRYSAFHLVSIMTTTGFATADYQLWPAFSQMLVFLMMFIGGCAGSAGGGMKVIRVTTMLRITPSELKKRIHPNGVFPVRVGKDPIADKNIQSIAAFCALYIAIWIVSSIVISLSGTGIVTSLTSTLLTLGNIGIGFGQTGPTGNFGFFPGWAKWVFSFLMLIGRLELYTVLVFFTKSFWKK